MVQGEWHQTGRGAGQEAEVEETVVETRGETTIEEATGGTIEETGTGDARGVATDGAATGAEIGLGAVTVGKETRVVTGVYPLPCIAFAL